MQEITILTPYLLTELHYFNVYLILGTRNAMWNFPKDQKGLNPIYQLCGDGTVKTAWPRIHPHGHLSWTKRLNPMDKKGPQELGPG
jgi:hypothetical protein